MITYFLEHNRYLNLVGICVILLCAFALSKSRKDINYRLIFSALLMQFIFAILVLRFPLGKSAIESVALGVARMYQFADRGAEFVFGNLVSPASPLGFIFAFKVLPVTIFFSAFMALLYHFNIVQFIVSTIGAALRPFLSTSPAETVCAIANSFLGQTESPLLVRNYLKDMTKSELFVVMLSGMATISGAILVIYAAMGVPATHMLASSIMSIPGAILIAKILIPETDRHAKHESQTVEFEKKSGNMFDSIATGTSDGLMLALNIAAMLIAFLALLAMGNSILAVLASIINLVLPAAWQLHNVTLDSILAYVLAPFGYLLGFTGREALAAGQLLGIKVAVNELIAYSEMVKMNLSPRTVEVLTYALCGFSNFSCIGIQIGGIGALVPHKRQWITQLGFYAVIGAALSNILSAMIASLLI